MANVGIDTIKASAPSIKREVEFVLDFGKTLDDAVALFGANVIHERAVRAIKIEAQSTARNMLNAGKSNEEIIAYMQDTWKPGEGADKSTNVLNSFRNMSPEEQKAMLQQLAALAAQAGK